MEDKSVQLKNDAWLKPKENKLQLLKGVFNILKEACAQTSIGVSPDIIKTIEPIKLEGLAGQAGWKLVSRSLVSALVNLIAESNISFVKEDIAVDHLDQQLDEMLETDSYFVTTEFFTQPEKLPFIHNARGILKEYLELLDFKENEIDNLLDRLQSYFVFALVNERRAFNNAAGQEKEWDVYLKWLIKQANASIFSESFGLRQIYVPPRAYYKKKKQADRTNKSFSETRAQENFENVVVDLQSHVEEWLTKGDKNDALRVIRAGPGHGKTSFFKILASDLAQKGKRVLFIPLPRFEIEDDLLVAVQNFVKNNNFLSFDPFGQEQLIILFDGLDELPVQGQLLSDTANQFLRKVEKKIFNLNMHELRLQVLVSGRDVIAQQNESSLRKEGQTLAILPYYLNEEESETFSDPKELLKKDQREQWWIKYGRAMGKPYHGLPGNLKRSCIDEFTAQPLLNYLVALSYGRGKINFSENPNLNEIFDDLLATAYFKSYSENQTYNTVKRIELREFTRILEEIAITAWHGNGRTTTVADIEKHFKDRGIKRLLDDFIKDAEKGAIALLSAFYCRPAGQTVSGAQTFEFTHKSFGEYLTARRIVGKIFQITAKLSENENNFDEGWSIKVCLTEWVKLFGPKVIDWDLIKYIHNELQHIHADLQLNTHHPTQLIVEAQETLVKLIDQMLKDGMPLEELAPRPSYYQENEQAINAEKALLIILSLTASITNRFSNITWPSAASFGEWIGRLAGQRLEGRHFILQFLNHLNLENAVLDIRDFRRANLRKANLRNTSLHYTNFNGADLSYTDLSFYAQARDANFSNADLSYINAAHSSFVRCNFDGATFRRANLVGVAFDGASFNGTRLTEANLQYANLNGVNLRTAELTGANFKNAVGVDQLKT